MKVLFLSIALIILPGCATLTAVATVEGAVCIIKLVKTIHGVAEYVKECKVEENKVGDWES